MYDSSGASSTSPGSSSSPPRRSRRPSKVRSAETTWLPLNATWTPHVSPASNPNPGSPATSTVAASAPVRPCRPSRTWEPTTKGDRCGTRSLAQRPARSRSSSAVVGTGRASRRPSSA
ncbi:Uncharacterised protein [Mycobacteroides abscessus]|nr:Uncharacterised protein [Mycobacteroides abscessus]